MEAETKLTVRGRASTLAKPDYVLINLSVDDIAPSSAEALARAGSKWAQLERILDELGIDEHQRGGSGVSVHPYYEPQEQFPVREKPAGWRASGHVTVRITSAELATKLVQQTASVTGAQVSAWSWVVAPTNPAHREAATSAAEEARARAESLAAALGRKLGRLLTARDDETGGGHFWGGLVATAGHGMMPVQEGWSEISAVVELTYALD